MEDELSETERHMSRFLANLLDLKMFIEDKANETQDETVIEIRDRLGKFFQVGEED